MGLEDGDEIEAMIEQVGGGVVIKQVITVLMGECVGNGGGRWWLR